MAQLPRAELGGKVVLSYNHASASLVVEDAMLSNDFASVRRFAFGDLLEAGQLPPFLYGQDRPGGEPQLSAYASELGKIDSDVTLSLEDMFDAEESSSPRAEPTLRCMKMEPGVVTTSTVWSSAPMIMMLVVKMLCVPGVRPFLKDDDSTVGDRPARMVDAEALAN